MDSFLALAQSTSATTTWSLISLLVLFVAISGMLLILWRRYLSRRMLMARVAELEALSAAGRAIVASELDINALCELIAKEAGNVIDTSTFQIGLFSLQHFYRIVYWTIAGERQETPRLFDLSEQSGLVGWVRDTQKPLLIRDFDREIEALPARPSYMSSTPPRSALFVPLVSGENVIGIISAQSDQPRRFTEEDKRRLLVLSNQAAAAIANARLFQKERMRAAHLELVGQIARQVNAIQDLDQIFEQVVELTGSTFGFDPVIIFGIDPESGDLVLEASSMPSVARHALRLKPGQGLIGLAAATHETVISNNTVEDPRYLRHVETLHDGLLDNTRSEISIPLIVDQRLLGVLDVQSEKVGAFGGSTQTVLEALAAEVASAIHKAQQFERQQGQAWVTTAQLQVAEALSRSRDLEEMASAVCRLTPMLIGTAFCSILLWNREFEVYQEIAFYADESGTAIRPLGRDLAIGDWGALDAVHVGQEAIITENVAPWLLKKGARPSPTPARIQIIPLLSAQTSDLQGVMLVEAFEPQLVFRDGQRPGLRRDELLANIAVQTGQAIESARLRLAQQEEAWVNTALLQVAETVNRLIDLNEILDTIVRLVPLLVGVESVMILFWNSEREVFEAGPHHGVNQMSMGLLETMELTAEEFQAMMPVSAELDNGTTQAYPLRLATWLKQLLNSSSALAFPLNAQGRMVGMMLIGTGQQDARPLSQRRRNILNGIAQQSATAVLNNQLYRESAERLRLQQELNVAYEIQASLLPENNPDIPGLEVASFWQAARQVSGDFFDFIPRSDGTWGIVIADVADKGVPAALFMALSRTILRTVAFTRLDPASVLMRTNEIINQEARSDLFVTVFYGVWHPAENTLVFANGGHNPPLLLHPNGKTTPIHVPGIALGVLPNIELKSSQVTLKRNETLLLYTDGVTEAMNEELDEFGVARLEQTARSTQSKSASAVMDNIARQVFEHAGSMPQSDDITLVVLQCTETPVPERLPTPNKGTTA